MLTDAMVLRHKDGDEIQCKAITKSFAPCRNKVIFPDVYCIARKEFAIVKPPTKMSKDGEPMSKEPSEKQIRDLFNNNPTDALIAEFANWAKAQRSGDPEADFLGTQLEHICLKKGLDYGAYCDAAMDVAIAKEAGKTYEQCEEEDERREREMEAWIEKENKTSMQELANNFFVATRDDADYEL
jgi:hypothetical protein